MGKTLYFRRGLLFGRFGRGFLGCGNPAGFGPHRAAAGLPGGADPPFGRFRFSPAFAVRFFRGRRAGFTRGPRRDRTEGLVRAISERSFQGQGTGFGLWTEGQWGCWGGSSESGNRPVGPWGTAKLGQAPPPGRCTS